MKIVPFVMVVGDVDDDDVVAVAFAGLDVVDDVDAVGIVAAYYYDLVVVAYVSSVDDFALAAVDDDLAKLFVEEHQTNRFRVADDELRLQVESTGEFEAYDAMVPVLSVRWSLQRFDELPIRLCRLLR